MSDRAGEMRTEAEVRVELLRQRGRAPTHLEFVTGEPTPVGRTVEIRHRDSPNDPWIYDALVVRGVGHESGRP